MTDMDELTKLAHIYRTTPPWRATEPPLTQCGREPNDVAEVMSIDEAQDRFKRLGQQRFFMTTCITCASTANRHFVRWEDDPLMVLNRDSWGSRKALVTRELHALAALAAAHPEEFNAYVAAGDDLGDRRAKAAGGRRRRPRG